MTVPDGVPAYCGFTVTVMVSLASCPYVALPADRASAVFDAALVTLSETAPDLDVRYPEVPEYVAVREYVPAARTWPLAGEQVAFPPASLAEQSLVFPAEMVTDPAGVPEKSECTVAVSFSAFSFPYATPGAETLSPVLDSWPPVRRA
jgi:hypothetical protein